jgi:hypothetical protein
MQRWGTLNNKAETDCWINTLADIDISQGGFVLTNTEVSCEEGLVSGILPGAAAISEEPVSMPWNENVCPPDPDDKLGNEWDWLRFYWDLYSKDGVSLATILSAAAIRVATAPTDETFYEEFLTAATALGFGGEFKARAIENGVDH